jgi:hypothetical protein
MDTTGRLAREDGTSRLLPAYDDWSVVLPPFPVPNRPHLASANSVGVLPVTCRKACENAGTLA